MQENFLAHAGAEIQRQTLLDTAHAAAAALHGVYLETLTAYLAAPAKIPLPRAARAMQWLGRIDQWQAIELSDKQTYRPNTNQRLQAGLIKALAGTHVQALHKETWSGANSCRVHEHDMALQIAMLLTFGWNHLAAFMLRNWFDAGSGSAGRQPLGGIAGMIVAISGDALEIPVVPSAFKKQDALLAHMVQHWRDNETAFVQSVFLLADRHIAHCRPDTDRSLYDFDHPVEQAIPVEIVMLLRLRGFSEIPGWLRGHPAFRHPAATLWEISPPVPSQRCASFLHSASQFLPRLAHLQTAIAMQATRCNSPVH